MCSGQRLKKKCKCITLANHYTTVLLIQQGTSSFLRRYYFKIAASFEKENKKKKTKTKKQCPSAANKLISAEQLDPMFRFSKPILLKCVSFTCSMKSEYLMLVIIKRHRSLLTASANT